MGRLKVTAPHKIKKNIPITRIGKKQYLKRRFAHIRKVDNAGKNNDLTQKYVKGYHTAGQSYTRLGLNIDPSSSKAVVESRKKFVKKEMKEKFSLYEENGVREYWIVYPEYFQLQVFDLKDDKFVWRSNYVKDDLIPVGIFEGFSININSMFRKKFCVFNWINKIYSIYWHHIK